MTHLVSEFRAGLMGPSHLAMLRRVEGLTVDVGDRLALAGGTMTGRLVAATPTVDFASINLPHGLSPTSSVSGDMWTTSANLFLNIGGSVRSFYHTGNLSAISQAEAETGTGTTNRLWTALRVRQAIDKAAFQTNGTIAANTDMNTLIVPGLWHQQSNANASLALNYPVALAGMLMVTASGSMVYQSYTVYNSGKVYSRVLYQTTWSSWIEQSIVGHTHDIAEVNGLQAALDAKAPLASPALTGTPTAPTQAAGNNSTRIATTAFVTAAVAKFGTDLAIAGVTGLQAALDAKLNTSGGTVNGEIKFNSSNGWRIANNDGAVFGRKDGTSFYIMMADSTDDGAIWNSLRPFTIALSTGRVTMSHGATINGVVTINGWTDVNTTVASSAPVNNYSFRYTYNGSNSGLYSHDGNAALYLRNADNTATTVLRTDALSSFATGINVAGNVTATGNLSAYSDERLKSDIKRIENGLDLVMQMTGVSFIMNGERNVGVIAQDTQRVLPEVVHEGEDENKTLSVSYGNMVGVLIEAIKDLKAEIEELKRKI